MAKVRYDVSDVEVMSFEQPKPGLYKCTIDEMDHGKSKAGNDQFKVVFKVKGGEFKGSNLFHYVPTEKDSPGYFRLAELTTALGLKPKGVIDTDKQTGKDVLVRVKADQYEGEYRARVGAVLAPKDEDAEEEEDLDDDEAEVDEDEDLDEDEDEDEEAEEPEADADGDIDYTTMSLAELREAAGEAELDVKTILKGRTKASDKKDALIDALQEAAEEGEAEEDTEGDDYDEWSIDELKADLKERGLKVGGKRSILVARLRKDDESDDDPFAA